MGQTLKRFLGQTAASQTTGPLPFYSQCPNLAIPKKKLKGVPPFVLLYFFEKKLKRGFLKRNKMKYFTHVKIEDHHLSKSDLL